MPEISEELAAAEQRAAAAEQAEKAALEKLAALEAEQEARLAAALAEKSQKIEVAAAARVVQAELRAEAVRAGMHNLADLQLADCSSVSVAADGQVTGAVEVVAALKAARPYLFAGASSTGGVPPRPKADEPVDARRLSDADWKAAREKLLRG